MFNAKLIIFAVLAHMAQSASKFVELKTEACTRDNDPGCDHICVVNPIYGPLCACHFGYVLYEDNKACVLTKEYLEAEQNELEEDYIVPVTIICLIGGLGKHLFPLMS
jgi:hypothetical protein